MFSIILCGGSGTRLWPLSRKNYPKQFLSLYSDKSLLQETFLRALTHTEPEDILFVTNKENYFNVFNQLKDIHPDITKEQIITEPKSMNTAPAIAYAVRYILDTRPGSEDIPVLIAPADHYIADTAKYADTVRRASQAAHDAIVTIGIVPGGPEIGYGYIKKGKDLGGHWRVEAFKEKPDRERAEAYVASGGYVWNSGMYLFSPAVFAEETEKHAPDLHGLFKGSFDSFTRDFEKAPATSIDYALSERTKNIVVFEGDFGWNDIGSFDSLADVADKRNEHIGVDSRNVFVYGTGDKMIATIGIEDVIVVENNDSILIQKRGSGEKVKQVVEKLKENDRPELEHNIIVHRPWGRYEVLLDTPTYKVKKIVVYPGEVLSLQSHEHRSEHWVVVKGTAKVVNGEREIILHDNESTYIPVRNRHRLGNPGIENLEIVEVQTGDYLGEDDIRRYDDIYERS